MNLHPTCIIADIPFHYITRNEQDRVLNKILDEQELRIIFTPNPEILLKSMELPWYKDILKQAYWNMPDGVGLLWASTFLECTKNSTSVFTILWKGVITYMAQVFAPQTLRHVLPDVITGQESFMNFHGTFQKRGTSIFYFGASDEVNAQIPDAMRTRFPGIHVVGHTGGRPFTSQEEKNRIQQEIEKARPEVLFVALSFPKQEQWVMEHRSFLQKLGVKLVMVVGGTYDVMTGHLTPPPAFLRKIRLEFLWRLLMEPKVRWQRILRAVFVFPYRILKMRLQER